MSAHLLVLDANILIRAVLGNKVRDLLMIHSETVDFFSPDVCLADARKYLPVLFEKRMLSADPALTLLSRLESILHIADEGIYQAHAAESQRRMQKRDIQDWPVVATALALNCGIWTEDQDFFGSGLPTWTTDRIHIFFEQIP